MIQDQYRPVEQYSPKSSPRGVRSPVVSRQDSTGTLKTTILLGKNPSIVPSGPFYLLKKPAEPSELTGATNFMVYYGLEHSYSKFSGKKLKEQLSSFLPTLPGVIDTPGQQDNSTLRSVIDKPPVGGKELLPLTNSQLEGFRLHPGPLPEQYQTANTASVKKLAKRRKLKHKEGHSNQEPVVTDTNAEGHEKKHKKQKRHDDDKERKKRKKEKKRKKQKHSPEYNAGTTPSQ